MGVFQPRFIFPNELAKFGLSTTGNCDTDNLGILDTIDTASIMVDEYCGRTDGDGNGSLVYSTYFERIHASPGRNIYRIPRRPLVALTPDTVSALQTADEAMSGYCYTGVQPNLNTLVDGSLSAIIGASGRYSNARRDLYSMQDQFGYANPLDMITLFGGPPAWTPVDMQNLDYDSKTGEVWLSAGLFLTRYTEVQIIYNSGFDPRNMPVQIKRATAAVAKNLMAKGAGTTGMTSFGMPGGITAQFNPDIFDINVRRLLEPFVTVYTG